MPKPSLANVFDAARAHLGADAGGGSAVYSNTILQEHFAKAWRVLYRTAANLGTPIIEREVYYVLPAYTTYLAPSTANVTDMAEPTFVQERGDLTKKTITGAAGTTTVTITSASHGFATNDMVTINGIVGLTGTEGVLWGITRVDANSFTLNGCIGSGTYSSGGVAVKSSDKFRTVDKIDRIDSIETHARISKWVWEDEAFRFTPTDTERQLRIGYLASGAPPSNTATVLGIDDCLDFLSTYTAASAARSRGATAMAQDLFAEALGPSRQEDASGGALGAFLTAATKQVQRIPAGDRRRMSFRQRRPQWPMAY